MFPSSSSLNISLADSAVPLAALTDMQLSLVRIHEQLQQQHQQKQQVFVLDLVEEDEPVVGCSAPPLPLGEATGVVVREVFMIFSGGLGEEVGSPSLASGAASEAAAAESEIVTMPPPSHNERASPEVAEVFVMAACPFPMAVSSASVVEAELKLEALVVDVMLTGYSVLALLIMLLLPPEC